MSFCENLQCEDIWKKDWILRISAFKSTFFGLFGLPRSWWTIKLISCHKMVGRIIAFSSGTTIKEIKFLDAERFEFEFREDSNLEYKFQFFWTINFPFQWQNWKVVRCIFSFRKNCEALPDIYLEDAKTVFTEKSELENRLYVKLLAHFVTAGHLTFYWKIKMKFCFNENSSSKICIQVRTSCKILSK